MIRSILLLLLLIELSPAHARGFGQTKEAVPNLPGRRADTAELPCRQKAEKLLDETLNFMERNYYRRAQVSWPVLAADAKADFGKPPAARMHMRVSAGVFIN